MTPRRLFTTNNTKAMKGAKNGYLTAVLHLLPARSFNGIDNLCPRSTQQCRSTCLVTAGNGNVPSVQDARSARTALYLERSDLFVRLAVEEIESLHRTARRRGDVLAVRVNGTSDLPALAKALRAAVPDPDVVFYDYTKIPGTWQRGGVHYTFSRSEENEADCRMALAEGVNVAVVFAVPRGRPLPETWRIGGATYPVVDGDVHDLRFLDPTPSIVGLRAKIKGPAVAFRQQRGFVVDAWREVG